jgi:hypothetical protein
MKHASLKIKSRVWLQALCIVSLLTPMLGYAAHRETTTTIITNISPSDRDFIARCLEKITHLIEKTDYQLREFFNERNSEQYRIHIDRFGNLLVEIEQELIKPLQPRTHKHESFRLAHEILVDLQKMLQSVYEVLKQHESSRPVALGLALQKLANEFINGHFRHNLECKIDNLTITVESIACHETNCLKQVIIRLYENNPLKDKDRTTILRCLSHRLGCR